MLMLLYCYCVRVFTLQTLVLVLYVLYEYAFCRKKGLCKDGIKFLKLTLKKVYNERLSENWQYTKTGHK